jgi:hypothetical protein
LGDFFSQTHLVTLVKTCMAALYESADWLAATISAEYKTLSTEISFDQGSML